MNSFGGEVLVVEDEVQIQKLLSFGLKENGFECRVVSSGEDALKAIANHPPRCVLLDIGLPYMSGMETLKKLRSFSSVPVVMITVEDEDETLVQALDCGADDYVTKPFSMVVLCSRLRAVLRRQEKSALDVSLPHDFSAGSFRMDFEARKVFAHGREVHLTVTEFEILSFFVENRGKVVTHQRILKKIWGDQAGDQMHYLRVYVNQLRRKIEQNPTIPKLILTEPGVGYRFEVQMLTD